MKKCVMNKFKNSSLFKPILCIVLVIMLGCMMKTIANAAEPLHNTYALRVSTGVTDGSCIGFFGIEYKGSDGNIYTHYVFPHDGDYAKGYENVVKDGEFLEQIRRERANNLGYYFEEWNNMDAKEVMGVYTEDMIFFQIPERSISSIENIYVYTDVSAGNSTTWTCTGLEVYQIEKVNGRKMYGYISGEQYLSFSGKIMASLVGETNPFASGEDRVHKISPDSKEYKLDTSIKTHEDTSATGDAEYIFKIDFADVYGAGIETFTNYEGKLIRELSFPEVLNLQVVYACKSGRDQMVNIPVITSALINAMGNVSIDTMLVDFAGQGESIAVLANLPDFKELVSVKLTYGPDEAMKESGIKEKDITQKRKNQKADIVNNEDLILVNGISMYKSGRDTSVLTYDVQDGTILLSNVSGNPLYYYTANSYRGTEVGVNATVDFSMQKYEEGVSLEPRDNQTKYMIVIDTDSAGTFISQNVIPNIEMSLSYTSASGTTVDTEKYSLRELAKDYYGYTPTASGEDYSYVMNIAKGQRLFVMVSLSGVEKFTSVSLNLTNSTEEWQMSNFAIYRVTEVSDRHAQWIDETEVYGENVKFSYYRKINGTQETAPKAAEVYNAGVKILFQNNAKQTIDFSSLNVTETTRQYDWMAVDKYSLNYKKSDANYLGFYNASEDYQVDVKVADNSNNSLDDGDSGSKNYFYFQLVFQDGTSAVVQANQLLQADGFITGQIATFNISTNYDYGDLVAVRIVPDDFTSNSDPYDKLNIEYINITKKSKSGYSTVWRVSDVGWIGIDYKDDGKAEDAKKETGRTLEELSYTYKVTGSSTGVEIEFAITTGVFPVESQGKPFIGSVMADIGYMDGHGGYKKVSVDVVQSIYNYANKTPRENAGNGKAQSDAEFMFLENRTNRFSHFLSDVSELVDIRLYVYSDGGGVLNISNISASLVVKEGSLGINNWGEYEKKSTLFPITQNDGAITTFEVGRLGNVNTYITFKATDEGMLKGVVNGTWPYDVKQETEIGDEYLNFKVYSSEKIQDVPDLRMQVVLDYSDSYGRTYRVQNSLTLKTASNGDFYYVADGVRASDISAVKRIKIEKVSGSGDMAVGDVIVQRVREDRIVQTSLYNLNGVKVSASAMAETTQNMADTGEVQKVLLSFADDMKGIDLIPQIRDVAVALRYTSSYDPNGQEYISPYVYLSESQVSSVTGGQIGEFAFNIKNVDKITGILVAATGGLAIETENAIVTTYQTTSDMMKLKDWYSVAGVGRIENESIAFAVSTSEVNSVNTVVPVTMELTTGVVNGQNTGTDAAIRMVMQYIGYDGIGYTLEVEDIRKYTVSGNYNTGETAKVLLLLSNVKEISFVTFEPYDQDQNVMESWKLGNITMSYGTELSMKNASITLTADKSMAYEGAPIRVVFKKIILQVPYRVGTANVVVTEDKKDYGTVIYANEEMYISAVAMNSVLGCDISVYELVDGKRRDVTTMYLSDQLESGEYIFKVPSTEAGNVFVIEAVSKELSEFKLSFEVSVKASPESSKDTEKETSTETENNTETDSSTETSTETEQ